MAILLTPNQLAEGLRLMSEHPSFPRNNTAVQDSLARFKETLKICSRRDQPAPGYLVTAFTNVLDWAIKARS